MRKIVVSDIFGRTAALDDLCKSMGGDVEIADPYAGGYMGFKNEQEAYECFMSQVGINDYCEVLKSILSSTISPVSLIGFSVGASAIWKISESLNSEQVKRVACFYGSQIRHSLDINPSMSIDLVLPAHEASFCVEELAKQLSTKKNLVLHNTPYLHGFMNSLSKNYCHDGYKKYTGWLRTNAG